MKTVLSDCTQIHWVLVHHHHDWDIPWESQYASQEKAIQALGREPKGQIFRIVPRPTKKGGRLYVWREF